MVIKMLKNSIGTANDSGSVARIYNENEIIDCENEWQKKLAMTFISLNNAIEVKMNKPTSTKKIKVIKKKER